MKLSKECHVELRKIDLSKYPRYIAKVTNKAWKPIITAEMAEEYEVILYGDASLRVLRSAPKELLSHLLHFPYVAGPTASKSIL